MTNHNQMFGYNAKGGQTAIENLLNGLLSSPSQQVLVQEQARQQNQASRKEKQGSKGKKA